MREGPLGVLKRELPRGLIEGSRVGRLRWPSLERKRLCVNIGWGRVIPGRGGRAS